MKLSGKGQYPGSVVYVCGCCPPEAQVKLLWAGRVVRTGLLDFGFVQIPGLTGLAPLRFYLQDCSYPCSPPPAIPNLEDQVLAMIRPDILAVRRLWILSPASPRVKRNASCHSTRRHGVVTALKSAQWGFLVDEQTGEAYSVHQSQVRSGGQLAVGQRVSFRPAFTPQGNVACEVDIEENLIPH